MMADILVFISGNPTKPLNPSVMAETRSILKNYRVTFEAEEWLCPEKALEFNHVKNLTPDALTHLRHSMQDHEIDVFSVSSHHRRKKLLLADMDATIVKGETLDDLADYAGLKDRIAPITERAMRGELDFKTALTERVALLKDLPVTMLRETQESVVINPGAGDVIRVMQKFGAQCYLVSGGFTFFTEDVAQKCGFDGHHGNKLEIVEGRLSGHVIPPILDKDAKLSFLNYYLEKQNLDPSQSMAIGDGANDIPMLQMAGLGVGYHPKPLVKEKINNHIIHTDLTSLLYIQGYTWQNMAT